MKYKKGHINWNKGLPKEEQPNWGRRASNKTKKKIGIGNSKPRIKKICPQCGKQFEVSPSQNTTIYCSRKCFGLASKGKLAWNKGLKGIYKTSDKTKRKLSETHIARRELHWNWKGGIATENDKARHNYEMGLWKRACFERDNFTCQKYGIKGGILNAHHINNFSEFPELRTAIDNGITLSDKTHKEFHKIYGKKNNTKEQLIEFLTL